MAIEFKHIHNPLEEDLIVEYLQSDNTFIQNRKEDFKYFTNRYFPNQSIFMSLKQQYINFAYFITKNALLATILMLLALTTVTAAAAELAAPKEYKPSTILNLKSETKQVQKPVGISSSSSSSHVSSSSVSSQVSTQTNSSITKTEPTTDQTSDWKTLHQYKYGYSFKIPGYLKDFAKTTDDNFALDNSKIAESGNLFIEGGYILLVIAYDKESFSREQNLECISDSTKGITKKINWNQKQVKYGNYTFNYTNEGLQNYGGGCSDTNTYWTEIPMKNMPGGSGVIKFQFDGQIQENPKDPNTVDASSERIIFPREDVDLILESLQVN